MTQIRSPAKRSFGKGFQMTSALLSKQIRSVGEKRGFAVTRLLTHWPDIVGQDVAGLCRPVNVVYGRGNFGATLTLLTTGAQAPMLEMQKETLRERINAVYGYNAISRIRLTQTSPMGFAEGQADFAHRKATAAPCAPPPDLVEKARDIAAPVSDDDLRAALERLARNVLTRTTPTKGSSG